MSLTKEIINPPSELESLINPDPEKPEVSLSEIIGNDNRYEETVSGLAKWFLYTDAIERGLIAEYTPLIEHMEGDIKECKQRKEYIKHLLISLIEPSPEANFVNDDVSIFFKITEKVEISDRTAIPIEYCKPPSEPEPDARLIKEAIEAGGEVRGAEIKQNFHIQIKEGGIRAQKNAKLRSNKRIEKMIEET